MRSIYSRLFLVGLIGVLAQSTLSAQYPRTVLIEEFTSVTCAPCVEATRVLNEVLSEKGDRVVSLRYHMNIPCPGDPWYQESKAHVDNRSQLYSVTGLPTARVDGFTAAPNNKPELLTAVNGELQETSPLQIRVKQEPAAGGAVKVTVVVRQGAQSLPNGFELHVALAEHLIARSESELSSIPCYNGETEFHDVFRRLLTPVNGSPLVLSPNDSIVREFTYTPDGAWQQGQIFAVAWVQDDFTNEVTQTGYSSIFESGVPFDEVEQLGSATLRPNPATSYAVIELDVQEQAEVVMTLSDNLGRVVRTRELTLDPGSRSIPLDLRSLPAGHYILTMSIGGRTTSASLIVTK